MPDSWWTDEGIVRLHFEATQLIARFGRGVDRRDYPLVRSLFVPEAVDDHGLYSGTVEQFIEGFDARHRTMPEAQHLNGPTIVHEVDSEARHLLVETGCVAWSRVLPEGPIPSTFYDGPTIPAESANSRLATVANRYLDLICEFEGELRFVYRTIIFEWRSVTEAEPGDLFPESWPIAKRDTTDPSYRSLAEVRDTYQQRREEIYGPRAS
jgi:hypothetical protein